MSRITGPDEEIEIVQYPNDRIEIQNNYNCEGCPYRQRAEMTMFVVTDFLFVHVCVNTATFQLTTTTLKVHRCKVFRSLLLEARAKEAVIPGEDQREP